MNVAYVLDEIFEQHRSPAGHPECPERVAAAAASLRNAGMDRRGLELPIRRATESEIGRIHTPSYISELSATLPGNSGWLDGDTFYSPESFDAAQCAAGAAVDLTAAVLDGRVRRGIAVVRPPGHHAEPDRAMGFCLFNNIAIAAAAARDAGCERVAIIDWDVHHGNGTEHAFQSDPSVLFASVHQYPFYPGTGAPTDVGIGDGAGKTLNVGLPMGCGDADYVAVFNQLVLPAVRDFRPQLILLSAGFDAHTLDPLAAMDLSTAGYHKLADAIVGVAEELCDGRVVAVLEGGYDLTGLGQGVAAMFDSFDGHGAPLPELEPSVAGRRAIAATEAAHRGVA